MMPDARPSQAESFASTLAGLLHFNKSRFFADLALFREHFKRKLLSIKSTQPAQQDSHPRPRRFQAATRPY
ncbi:hypothetical protein DPMN_112013 [Dreissena polymorpha]|uniref:Uncharacterized protein n=1 Tax=Dreissena polymorpha TaxID=45954 RepID=A0A9D4QPJ1_DREPO|nr:hypothetical protein DPMN_112013 [Dreissena polymorpha]